MILENIINSQPLIPRSVLFSDPDRASPQLSPDGQYLAFLAPHMNTLNIWLAKIDSPDDAWPLTNEQGAGIRSFQWTFDFEHILYQQDQDGDENWRIYALNIRTQDSQLLTPANGVRASIENVSYLFPNEVLITTNERRPDFFDLYKVDVLSGEKQLICQNDQYIHIMTDDHYHLRFASKIIEDGGMDIYRHVGSDHDDFEIDDADDDDASWQLFIKVGPDDVNTTSICGFDKSGKDIYLIDSRDHDTSGLTIYSLETQQQTLVWRDIQADISSVMFHPVNKTIQGVASSYLRKEWNIIDEDVKNDLDYIMHQNNFEAEIDIVSRTHDDKLWIILFHADNAPGRYYLYNRPSKKLQYLFANRTALEGIPLTTMHSIVINSRDHKKMVCYLTVPLQYDIEQTGVPSEPIPLILVVHGGPQARDHWGYNSFHQWLANRGYAVLAVNYRGSTGFGKSFTSAGYGEWSAKMHDDLLDAVNWAIDQKIADKHKICIFGGSYGGYAALVGLTFTPDTFACAVDIVGPSNLVTLAASIPAYWKPIASRLKLMVGADYETEAGQKVLLQKSPINYADRIIKPLLIGHGSNDPRVKLAESDQIVAALKLKNIPVTYVVYPDEGHGFQQPANWRSFNAITEIFLAQSLGGRIEQIGNDFKDSSIQIKEGADIYRK